MENTYTESSLSTKEQSELIRRQGEAFHSALAFMKRTGQPLQQPSAAYVVTVASGGTESPTAEQSTPWEMATASGPAVDIAVRK